jgi:hypothetical protein
MISRWNYIKSNKLPSSLQCRVTSEIPVSQLSQIPSAWCTLSTLAADNPIKVSKLVGNKKLRFTSKHKRYESLTFISKLVHTILVVRENLEVFTYSGKRKEPSDTIRLQLNDLPISLELERIALSTQKKPFGNLKIKVELRVWEDRIYVIENFWRMLNLPLERKYIS